MPTKVCLVKAMVFPVVMYGCESWTIKKAKHQRIDAFELWCWRRLLRVPWTARRSNRSILKEIIPGCSLEGLILKLKFQYFDHLMWRIDSLEKTLMLGRIESKKRRGEQRMRWLDGVTYSIDMSLCKLWEWWWTRKPGVLRSMQSERVRHDWATELNWNFIMVLWGLNELMFLKHLEYCWHFKSAVCRHRFRGQTSGYQWREVKEKAIEKEGKRMGLLWGSMKSHMWYFWGL